MYYKKLGGILMRKSAYALWLASIVSAALGIFLFANKSTIVERISELAPQYTDPIAVAFLLVLFIVGCTALSLFAWGIVRFIGLE